MFNPVIADFEARVREVDLYFDLLAAIEKEQVQIIPGIAPQVLPVGDLPTDCDRMLKGASYLVLYNLVEAFVVRGFQSVFDSIGADQLRGVELTEALRRQWVMQRNRTIHSIDGSPKLYMGIAIDIIEEILRKQPVKLESKYLGGGGNLDARVIRSLCKNHGIDHQTSARTYGGAALHTVKKKRNSLGHGDESFADCGKDVTASELIKSKDEVVQFVREILENLRRFSHERQYHAAWR